LTIENYTLIHIYRIDVTLSEILGYWRRHPLSITMNRNEEIFEGFLRYCDEFVETYYVDLRKLNLTRHVEKRGAIAYLSLGLMKISNKDYNVGKKLIKESLKGMTVVNWPFKIRIIIALFSAYFHFDLPRFLMKIRNFLYQK